MKGLNKLNQGKLRVDFKSGISQDGPIIPRKYTVTHSDETGEIVVTVAKHYDKSNISNKRDEVFARWFENGKNYVLCLYLNVDGIERDKNKIVIRNKIFREELPIAITAIRQGDLGLIKKHNNLDEADVFIKFNSRYEDFYKVENWGKLKNYKYIDDYDEYEVDEVEEDKGLEERRNSLIRKRKCKITMQERIILNLLNPYIENRLCILYGNNIRYYIEKYEIVDIEEVKTLDGCEKIYEVFILAKIKINSIIRNVSMEFIVKPNKVIIKKVKE